MGKDPKVEGLGWAKTSRSRDWVGQKPKLEGLGWANTKVAGPGV